CSMAKELTLRRCPGDEANRRLLDILRTGHMPPVEFPAHPLNREGRATGTLIGGNLAVLDALVGTPFNLLLPDSILVIEDVSEPIYKVERMLWRLSLCGVLDSLRGFVVGQFTDYRPSADWADMYSMIARFTSRMSCPVAFGAPFGHIDGNLPFIEGAEVSLEVTPSSVKIM
ncbi:MAG: LD-carboxypeptidase, partial [Muribaculaceae bacterium]|nr:LD-carboxypeptidase [Muribaculaceae bacterium]